MTHAEVLDGYMYIFAGIDGSNKNDVWRTADGSNWTQMADAPWIGRHKTASCVHNGYI